MIPFQTCSTFSLCGATKSGKTTWLFNFFKHLKYMFEKDTPEEILYCFETYQPLYDDMKKVCPIIKFHYGLPSEETISKFASTNHKIIVLDDLMAQVVQSPEVERLFFVGAHHRCLSIITLNQNLYAQGPKAKSIQLNTAYLILFRSLRDVQQISVLSRQVAPGQHSSFMEMYKDVMLEKYGYLILDFTPSGKDEWRFRTHIFPGEKPIIYTL